MTKTKPNLMHGRAFRLLAEVFGSELLSALRERRRDLSAVGAVSGVRQAVASLVRDTRAVERLS